MKPRITVITLGVDDLERSLAFYRNGLGFPTQGIIGKEFEHGAVAFFDMQPGLKLALWSRADIAHDTNIAPTDHSPTELTIGHNVSSREEVDAVMQQAQSAGAQIIKPARETFWGGYAGYFKDPDDHLWEVVWNPHLLPE
ncbi:VOC family protein [Ktedonobacter racemifer]|uniref:Glyoxalase/bleomycin resistance protein/dioxygenase n=1 Tax=Ktedonobacter racemifer DSM 44963 TaxID=485913 RepID=D6TWZ2_KTERA|nr:VOC family protein [Ktedonobacter racemifer]EFH84725.1 Glyoxalase/bleomycin resistance protein/dioxygenase [Ktedonobacter racemifer DSM 44963]